MNTTVSPNNTATKRTEILFIESNVPDSQSLLNAVTPSTEVHILDASIDGLVQMARMLSGRSEIDAIHLISHGTSGTLQLGSVNLTTGSLAAYGAELRTIGNALKPGGDFLLYGCNVGEGETGAQFIGQLAQTLGADVSASTDLTGDAAKGGDWHLEYATGNIETTALNVVSYQGVLAAPVFGQGGGSYSRTDIPVFTTPPLSRIATADINGDGKADLIVANQSTLTVLTSNGDGTLSESGLYLTGDAAIRDLTVADVNNDGKADVILVQQMTVSEFGPNKNASVLLNNGDGSFAAGIDFFSQPDATEIISADLNGDGKIDLLSKQSGDIAVQVGNGDGTFEWPVNYSVGAGSLGFLDTSTLAIADLNRDGKLDVVVTDAAGQDVSVLFNNGDGSLGSKIEYATSGHPSSTIGADVTGDGWVDLITTYEGRNSVSVKINNGDGTFAADVDYEAGHPIYGSSNVIAVEINGDASTDLVVQNFGDNTVSVLKNNGDGSFTGKTDLATGAGPVEIAAADFNGDGRMDIVTSNWLDRSLSVLLNQDKLTPTVFFKQTPVAVTRTLTLSDPDGDSDWSGGQLKIQITANSDTNDFLTFPPDQPGPIHIWTDAASNLMAGMTPIGSASGPNTLGSDAWVFTFNSNATNALVQDVVRAVVFGNTGDTRSTMSRTVTFTATDAGRLSASAEQTITVSAANGATLTYSPAIFSESTLDDGSIVTSSLITLSNETFTGFDGEDWSPNVSNVPAGLIPRLIRNDATHATLSFSGQAMAHANSDDLNNLTVTFSDWQFSGGSAATVAGATTTNLAIDFDKALSLPKTLSYSTTTFVESPANDGSITTTSTISLTNDTFTGNDGDDWSSIVTNVPTGLTAKLIRSDATHATLSFTGQAVAHANAADLNSLSVVFDDLRFTGGSSAIVAGATNNSLVIDFNDPPPKALYFSRTSFGEAAANDGSITTSSFITLTNETFTGSDGDDWSSIVSNVPAGLSASLIRTDATHATLSFSGQAAAHGNLDDKFDLTVAFDDGKFVGGSAATVSGAMTNNLAIYFAEPSLTTFSTRVDYATGANAHGLISVDVNNDGKIDLVNANYEGGTVSVLLGNGDGSFANKAEYAAGIKPRGLTSTDVNGDGKVDLIVTIDDWNTYSDRVSVLINDGNGGFASKAEFAVGDRPYGVTSADINNDGNTDLVVANQFSDTISVLTGNGDGSFANKIDYTVGNEPVGVASADINNDGMVDVIVSNRSDSTVSVLINNGNGTFAAKRDFATGMDPTGIVIADVNGDGNGDLITTNLYGGPKNYGSVSVLAGMGDGSFGPMVEYNFTDYSRPYFSTVADVNGDTKLDVIVSIPYRGTLAVLENNGDGGFFKEIEYAVGSDPLNIGSADFNGDGKMDVVVGHYREGEITGKTLSVLLNTQDNSLSPDLDGDGIANSTENNAPGLSRNGVAPISGDGNGDGLRDSAQNEITSVPFLVTSTAVSNPGSAPASYVTLVADAQAGLVDTTDGNSAILTQLKQLDAPADKPANINMPLGLISFVADVGTPGTTETFSLFVDNSFPVNGYFKKNAAGDWVNIATAVVNQSTKTRIDFAITDGGEFDADGLANGIITDPGAIGFQAKSLSFGETTFVEAAANNGLITTSSVITLINESFTGNTGDDWSSIVSNVPAGLTASLIRNDATHATLSFTGKAEAHANVDDVSNLTVVFDDGKFTGNSASDVIGATVNNLLVDFADPPVNHLPTGSPVDMLPDGTEDTLYPLSAKSLLAGFADIDGDTLSVANLTADHASVTDLGDGTWTLAPTSNYNGQVSLRYDVVDGNGGSIAATQHFALLAVDDVAIVGTADVTVQETNAPLVINGVLSINDIDSPASFVAQPGSGGKYGTFTLGTDGAWSYKAKLAYDYLNVGDSLKDSFQVKTSDGTLSSVSVTIAGTADTTSVHLGDAPTAQSGTGGQWAQAWSQTGYALLHKADHTNGAEAWSTVKLSGVSSQTLVGGDIYAGDLGVSGQSLATSTIRQEIDGKEVLRVTLPSVAESVTLKLSNLFANDDGSAFSESGLLRLLDDAGQIVAQRTFYADSASGAKTVTLAAAIGFTSMELIAGAYDSAGSFIYGGYSTAAGTFGSASSKDTAGKFHGSDFLVDSLDFSVMLVGVEG